MIPYQIDTVPSIFFIAEFRFYAEIAALNRLFIAEILVDRLCSRLARTHCGNNGCGTGNGITAGVNAFATCETCSFFNNNSALFVYLKTLGGGLDERVGAGADCDDNGVDIKHKLAAGHGNGTAAALFIGFAEFHADALHAGDETVLGIALVIGVVVTENLNGIVEQFEFNALFHCVFNFLTASGKFLK